MKTAFLYAGQGAQKPGMGKDFYEEYGTYRKMADRLFAADLGIDADLKKLMDEGPMEELSRTEYTQVCMAVFAAGVTELLKENGIIPDAACGLSLGEYGALYAAGVFSAEEYAKLLAFRGKAMAEAARGTDCAMSAVMGLDSQKIREICESCTDGFVAVANYNCPGQTVICGDLDAVEKTEQLLKEAGGRRCIRLKVSGPFHTKYMAPAGEALASYFSGMNFGQPQIPVASNAAGTFYSAEDSIPDMLVRQVQSSVYLEDDLKALLDTGYTRFIEIGPGKTMSGFLNKTAKAAGVQAVCHSIDSVKDLKALLDE